MIDCAVPMEAMQGDAPFEPAMTNSTWQEYSSRLYASCWWQLFTNGDARSTLTWSNRFGNLRNVDIYNFYSPGEEVLREDTDDPPPGILNAGVTQLINIWAGVAKGAYVWVWEEKGKGLASEDDFISSTHGGWKFNDTAYGTNVGGFGTGPIIVHMSAEAAALLNDSQLQTNAFFDFSSDTVTADLALYSSGGSAYAQANRDRILSDAIPALTLPVGANYTSLFDDRVADTRNFNMQDKFQTGWPTSRSTGGEASKWHHSDFDYVAYPFTHKLFDEIVNDGSLKQKP